MIQVRVGKLTDEDKMALARQYSALLLEGKKASSSTMTLASQMCGKPRKYQGPCQYPWLEDCLEEIQAEVEIPKESEKLVVAAALPEKLQLPDLSAVILSNLFMQELTPVFEKIGRDLAEIVGRTMKEVAMKGAEVVRTSMDETLNGKISKHIPYAVQPEKIKPKKILVIGMLDHQASLIKTNYSGKNVRLEFFGKKSSHEIDGHLNMGTDRIIFMDKFSDHAIFKKVKASKIPLVYAPGMGAVSECINEIL